MTGSIEFYFDFSSPYSYFASHKVEILADKHGREVAWKPVMIGAAFKQTGALPLTETPLKGEYAKHDWQRLARFMEVPWTLPEPFPIAALAPSRAFYWLADKNPGQARLFARTAFAAYYGEGRDISSADVVADLAAPLHVERSELLAAIEEPAIKERLKRETEQAVHRGVFGAPFIFIDGEPFWGSDRMWMIDKYMETPGLFKISDT
tara:strand:+ start:1046 stop:1666 length:621 start_codon:yes stop_codon:yes gene_type:complete